MARIIKGFSSSNFGVVGEGTTVCNVEVGDLIYYRLVSMDCKPCVGVVVKRNRRSCVMGSVSDSLELHTDVKVIVPHELMTDEILKHYHPTLSFTEVEKMTKEQIEQKLGYPIEIVEG